MPPAVQPYQCPLQEDGPPGCAYHHRGLRGDGCRRHHRGFATPEASGASPRFMMGRDWRHRSRSRQKNDASSRSSHTRIPPKPHGRRPVPHLTSDTREPIPRWVSSAFLEDLPDASWEMNRLAEGHRQLERAIMCWVWGRGERRPPQTHQELSQRSVMRLGLLLCADGACRPRRVG